MHYSYRGSLNDHGDRNMTMVTEIYVVLKSSGNFNLEEVK